MGQVAFDAAFLERSERYKGTRRAEAAVDLLRNGMLLAAQREERDMDRLRASIAASPLLFAAVQSDRLDPLMLAALAGDGFMRDVAGHPPRGGQRTLTAFDLIARDAMTRHAERCSASPDAAARLESRWASNRSSIRDGYLNAPLRALEQTYGAACQSLIDARCGHPPLQAPPPDWRPGPVTARLADPLRVEPVVARLRAAPRAHARPAEWIPPAQVRNLTPWWRTRWQASGVSRAQQLERRSAFRVPVSRWLFRRGMRRALEAGPDATASYLRRVAANPRRVAAARAEGLDPLIVAAALGPEHLRDHVHGRPVGGRTNLHRLYDSLAEVRQRRLADAAVRARGGQPSVSIGGERSAADAEFAGLYDAVVEPQARAAGLVTPPGGLASRCHSLEAGWIAHQARRDGSDAPPLHWGHASDYADTGPYRGRSAAAAGDPSEMSLDDLLQQGAAVPDSRAPAFQPGAPTPIVPPIPQPSSLARPGARAEVPRVSDPVPVRLDGRDMFMVTVPPEVVTADAGAELDDAPRVTLNSDGSYTVHDRPPVERVVPQPDGSYRVYMTDDPRSEQPARTAAWSAEHAAGRGRPAGPAPAEGSQPVAPVQGAAPPAPPVQPVRPAAAPVVPESPQAISREALELDFAERFGAAFAERLRAGASVIDPLGDDAASGPSAGPGRGAGDPVVIGDDDVVAVGGPAAFALAADAAERTRAGGDVAPFYVTAERLSAAGGDPSGNGPAPVVVPDPWGGERARALYPVDALPEDVARRLPGLPAAPPYDCDADDAPAYQHFIAGAISFSGVKSVRDLPADPTAKPAFIARDGGAVALFPAASVATLMHDAAHGQDARSTRQRVARQTACHSANLRACAEAVADRVAGDADSMPAADRALAARLGVWQLSQRIRSPHASDAPARALDPDADPGVRGEWETAAGDPRRMAAVLRTAAAVSDTMLREAFGARDRDRGRSDPSRPEVPDPQERPPRVVLPSPDGRGQPDRNVPPR